MRYFSRYLPRGAQSLFFRFASGWFQQLWKAVHQVWLESTGALFLGMGALAIPAALKEWHSYQRGGSVWRPLVVALFMLTTVCFGIGSFFRARRLR
jgi:hypothetical protein